jgi:rubrerythrin
MINERFKYGTIFKEYEKKPEKCPMCKHKRIQEANFKDVPKKNNVGHPSKYSDRYVYMCCGCGHVIGFVKDGPDQEMYIKTFKEGDCGERYDKRQSKI